MNDVIDVIVALQDKVDRALDYKRGLIDAGDASAVDLEFIEGRVAGYVHAIILLETLLKGAGNE